MRHDVINHKTTKFESNSQHWIFPFTEEERCYQSQNYKIWKQFTTVFEIKSNCFSLLSITKLQNLKAIHNDIPHLLLALLVVINQKTTKFESNSQHPQHPLLSGSRCYQSQNYKIWKQFTTFSKCKIHRR